MAYSGFDKRYNRFVDGKFHIYYYFDSIIDEEQFNVIGNEEYRVDFIKTHDLSHNSALLFYFNLTIDETSLTVNENNFQNTLFLKKDRVGAYWIGNSLEAVQIYVNEYNSRIMNPKDINNYYVNDKCKIYFELTDDIFRVKIDTYMLSTSYYIEENCLVLECEKGITDCHRNILIKFEYKKADYEDEYVALFYVSKRNNNQLDSNLFAITEFASLFS